MRILLTAFEPYDQWEQNSSWLALVELLRNRPTQIELITRRYPVDIRALEGRLRADLSNPVDAILHLGQQPGLAHVSVEAVALNVAGRVNDHGSELPEFVESGPLAFRSQVPVGELANRLKAACVPAGVSYHAGAFLCNAIFYLSHHLTTLAGYRCPIGFIHLPLATEQVAGSMTGIPSLPVTTLAKAIRISIEVLSKQIESDLT